MASIVLILSHPSLDHPEATVRTRFLGQSRNLWNVGGHGPGIFALKGFSLILISGLSETESSPDKNRLVILLGASRGQARWNLRPTGTYPRLWSTGGRALLALEGTIQHNFSGRSF